MPDINFDPLFERFSTNIYGSTKGYVRQHIVDKQLHALLDTLADSPIFCADIGGGMGQLSETLASRQHRVDYFDISEAMYNFAKNNTSYRDKINFNCSPFQSGLTKSYQLITCQAVLEWLESPLDGLEILCNHVSQDGYLFLLFYNNASIILRNLVRGNLNAALADTSGNGSGLTPINPLEIDHIFSALTQHGLTIESWFGVRCFSDLQQRDVQQRLGKETLLEFEQQVSERDPFRAISRYVGVIAKKTTSL